MQLSPRLNLLLLCLVGAGLSAGCGESSDSQGSGSGGAGGSGAAAGSGGTAGAGAAAGSGGQTGGNAGQSSGGSAGNEAACPDSPPRNFEPCSQAVNNAACPYQATCTTGAKTFEFVCGSDDRWMLDEKPCEHQAEHCGELPVSCNQGTWSYWKGVNAPPTCPITRPEGDAPCTPNDGECGYFCADGVTWTVLYCTGQTWVSDGACP